MQDDEVFNDCQYSDHEFDDEVVSIDSQQNSMGDYFDDSSISNIDIISFLSHFFLVLTNSYE